ncbi:septation ring formation regulator EzrA [Marinilactibacillus sp. XAAS-LB27]|uniref:septation ring formation regulator EzrA n=1 Tax=Marinilactibacillus sp. XAAS-LB27 TaxID=3114538 RepID=UPI002E1983E7|nr:septation ring formation regulator EzrA [Marinilactibacillus sp. XAAS-LB27]
MTLEIVVIILIVLIVALYITTYLVRKKHYKEIDELDIKKKALMEQFPTTKIQSIDKKSMTGQSQDTADELKKTWDLIETKQFPSIESLLFEAEQATDRYRFKRASTDQEAAEEKLIEVRLALKNLNDQLDELMQREEDNLKRIETIKKRYHSIRKDLLAKSFSFGRAVDALEDKLGIMESDFATFSHLTVTGDHEEANQLLKQLDETIGEMEIYMVEIPVILEKIEEETKEQVQELESGYQSLKEEDYIFPDDSIKEALSLIHVKIESINKDISKLEITKAEEESVALDQKIDSVYDQLELEVESKSEVRELLNQIRKILLYLKEQNRKLLIEIDRLSQSYHLYRDEAEGAEAVNESISEQEKLFMKINQDLTDKQIAFSEASEKLNGLFDELEELNKKQVEISSDLSDYRDSELEIIEDLEEMELAMREMKRYVESKNLPGLPQEYLEFFFYTTDHVQQLNQVLAKPRLDMNEVYKLHEMCEDDVDKLADKTDKLVDQAILSELVSQRLYRYKNEHSEVAETIRYSRNLFSEDYDYETSLKMVREKLESIEPGAYELVEKTYLKEKSFTQ